MTSKTTFYTRFGKRVFDIFGTLIAIVISIPLVCFVSICIILADKGPVFFAQERMGAKFSRFRLLKFRTMVVDSATKGSLVTKGNDPRITKIGRFLRKSKLDELPQLLNVLKGDMSIVGPRPEVEKYVIPFRNEYKSILSIRPGIADYATLEYKDEQEILNHYKDTEEGYIKEVLPAKIELYNKYLREMSFSTDLKIIFKTLLSLLS